MALFNSGVFIDMINRFVEHGLQFQKFDVVFFADKRLDRHNEVIHAVVNRRGIRLQAFGKRQGLVFGFAHKFSFVGKG